MSCTQSAVILPTSQLSRGCFLVPASTSRYIGFRRGSLTTTADIASIDEATFAEQTRVAKMLQYSDEIASYTIVEDRIDGTRIAIDCTTSRGYILHESGQQPGARSILALL